MILFPLRLVSLLGKPRNASYTKIFTQRRRLLLLMPLLLSAVCPFSFPFGRSVFPSAERVGDRLDSDLSGKREAGYMNARASWARQEAGGTLKEGNLQ